MKGLIFLLLLLQRAVVLGQIQLAQDSEKSSLQVNVVDAFGITLTSPRIVIEKISDGDVVIRREMSKTSADLPYGKYLVKVSAIGFKSDQVEVRVDHPQTRITVSLQPQTDHVNSESPVLSGQMSPTPSASGHFWARLVGVFNKESLESTITDNGYFKFDLRVPGVYVLIIVNDNEIIDIRSVKIFGHTDLDLQIGVRNK